MWSGILGCIHDSSARGPGFNSHLDPDGISQKRFHSFIILVCQVEINNILIQI